MRHDLVGLPLFDVILGHLDALVPEEFLRGERVVDVGRNLAAYVVLMEKLGAGTGRILTVSLPLSHMYA